MSSYINQRIIKFIFLLCISIASFCVSCIGYEQTLIYDIQNAGGTYIIITGDLTFIPYTANNGENYIIVPGYKKVLRNTWNTDTVKRLAGDRNFSYLFALTPTKTGHDVMYAIDIDGSVQAMPPDSCRPQKIDPILHYHPNIHTVPIKNNIVLGNLSNIPCLYTTGDTTVSVIMDDAAMQDMTTLPQYTKEVDNVLSAIAQANNTSSTRTLIDAIHDYIVTHSLYDYNTLSLAQGPEYSTQPFIISSFFAQLPIVCVSYVHTFAYLAARLGHDNIQFEEGWIQPLNTQGRLPQLGHIWIQIDDLYYDPTFDATLRDMYPDVRFSRYRGIPYVCNVLDHVVEGGPIFHTQHHRAQYIARHLPALVMSCPGLVMQTIKFDKSYAWIVIAMLHDIGLLPYPAIDTSTQLPFRPGVYINV